MKMQKVARILLYSSLVSCSLFVIRATLLRNLDYWYLIWNLFLAWVPLFFMYLLIHHTQKNPWISLKSISMSILWLVFLPNSFYIATDFIHLIESPSYTLLFDIVLILSFTFNGFLLGYTTVIYIHNALLKKITAKTAHLLIGLVFLLCSFAIYLGRYLRWNTWDIISNPLGILFDVSERFINPSLHEQTFRTTALFFVLISTFYLVLWQFNIIFLEDSTKNREHR
ncbi:DUF1361 domain-containing protein [Candidatus Saccharibacteria bacterium]|nr:DUF1361 domain-containing protein [Candidatus Saccharibacteria bacterium]